MSPSGWTPPESISYKQVFYQPSGDLRTAVYKKHPLQRAYSSEHLPVIQLAPGTTRVMKLANTMMQRESTRAYSAVPGASSVASNRLRTAMKATMAPAIRGQRKRSEECSQYQIRQIQRAIEKSDARLRGMLVVLPPAQRNFERLHPAVATTCRPAATGASLHSGEPGWACARCRASSAKRASKLRGQGRGGVVFLQQAESLLVLGLIIEGA